MFIKQVSPPDDLNQSSQCISATHSHLQVWEIQSNAAFRQVLQCNRIRGIYKWVQLKGLTGSDENLSKYCPSSVRWQRGEAIFLSVGEDLKSEIYKHLLLYRCIWALLVLWFERRCTNRFWRLSRDWGDGLPTTGTWSSIHQVTHTKGGMEHLYCPRVNVCEVAPCHCGIMDQLLERRLTEPFWTRLCFCL